MVRFYGLKIFWVLKNFWSSKFFQNPKFGSCKILGSETFWVMWNFESWKIASWKFFLVPKQFLVPNFFLIPRNFWLVLKNVWFQKIFGSKKFLIPKFLCPEIFWVMKNFGYQKFLGQKNFGFQLIIWGLKKLWVPKKFVCCAEVTPQNQAENSGWLFWNLSHTDI